MTTKPEAATHRAKSPLSEFYATATPEQKRAIYMKALSEAKAEQNARRAEVKAARREGKPNTDDTDSEDSTSDD